MLAILLSWIVISVVFLSFGDFFVFIYNKFCKKDETYDIISTFLLGMCFTVIILSISSLWLASNHYILFVYLILSSVYWTIRKERLQMLVYEGFENIKSLTSIQLGVIIFSVVSIAIAALWAPGIFDAFFYHQQTIRWNEEFPVVPGLANLEDRIGLNSNYFLLCAIFSFRFLFSEAIYTMQPLLLCYIIGWVIFEVIKSNYDIKRLLLLGIFSLFIVLYTYAILTTTSSDIIPNLILFFIACRFILQPDRIKNEILLVAVIPIMLVTFKVSIIPFAFLSLFILINLVRDRDLKTGGFIVITALMIMIPWLTRNVIISGYLIYPLAAIDIFNFDWKVPLAVAIQQQEFITFCAKEIMNWNIIHLGKFWQFHFLINWILFFIILVSPLVVLVRVYQRKFPLSFFMIYLSLVLTIIVWYIGAPDFRFISGVILSTAFATIILILPDKVNKQYPKVGIIVCLSFMLIVTAWAAKRFHNNYAKLNMGVFVENTEPLSVIWVKPYSYREQLRRMGFNVNDFDSIKMNYGHTVYLGKMKVGGRDVVFDKFPATIESTDNTSKFQNVKDIEARGPYLKNGFRSKKNNVE